MTTGSGLRAQTVRQRNLSLVFDTVRLDGPATRSELVKTTGLTRSTISGLVGELVDLGLALEVQSGSDGRRGRPSPMVHLDDRNVAAMAIGIDVGLLSVAIVGIDGAVIQSTQTALPSACEPQEVVATLIDLAADLGCSAGHALGRRLIGVGVAIPALVRQPGNVVERAPNLGWEGVGLGALIQRALADRLGTDIPATVDNEANLAGLAEVRFGAATQRRDVFYVHGDVGVGGTLFVDGVHATGHSGFAGEVGHMPVHPDGNTCRCGSVGCWETEIGVRVLGERAGLGGDLDGSAVRRIVEAHQSGDEQTQRALNEHGRWVAIGLAALINVLDPGVIVLGGRLGQLFDSFEPSMRRVLSKYRILGLEREVEIVPGQLGADATLIGAAQLAISALGADPSGVVLAGT